MTVLRVPAALLAWVLAELVRDVLGALGAILYAIGRATFRLLWIPTVVLIVYAIMVRATVRVAMPPVVWLVLTGVWLAAVALWVIGGVFRYVVLPRPVAYIRARPRTGPVSAERIGEWESAWRRALRWQEATSQGADFGDQRASEDCRREAGSAAADSPYEILEVDRDVTHEQLRAAYRELVMRVHPDRNPGFVAEATERFAAIHAAYELLSDPGRRAAYDQRSDGC